MRQKKIEGYEYFSKALIIANVNVSFKDICMLFKNIATDYVECVWAVVTGQEHTELLIHSLWNVLRVSHWRKQTCARFSKESNCIRKENAILFIFHLVKLS